MDSSKVYLIQTDTTVGFSSSDDEKLSEIKQRPTAQKTLQTVDSFKTLQRNTRIPKRFRKRVRNSQLSTFIYPNTQSYRVVGKESQYYDFLKKIHQCYSTSANKTQHAFDFSFVQAHGDIIVSTKENFCETNASSIYRINKKKIHKIR